MRKIFIVGGGKGGTALLKKFMNTESFTVSGLADINVNAPGMKEARKYGIATGTDFRKMIHEQIDVIIEATGKDEVFGELREIKSKHTVVIPGMIAKIVMSLIEEKEELIQRLKSYQHELDIILNSTYDGMIAVNQKGVITLFNRAAERIVGLNSEAVIGKKASDVIQNTRLDIVLQTGQSEINHEQYLINDTKIITNRVPVINDDGEVTGAVAVFRDVTDIKVLTEEVTELKQAQSLLEAIINSSDDAISVVDEHGLGLLVNPAYTRLIGLQPEDIIGQPADVDISEGESMHMKVLRTGKAIRGTAMKVGKQHKDVLVNVAPVHVEGKLKGSVGIIHDISELKKLNAELERARKIIRTLEAKYTFEEIIGASEPMQAVLEQAKKAATTSVTVLLRGESGTGKELFAHAIHNASTRKFNQFIRVNCAAISKHLIESELFGYEAGAFTGARPGGKKGLFEEASGGTIFLDEIGELPLETQAKLLRVLQEKEIVRVGGTKTVPVHVRVIAATNLQLEKAVQQGSFREDLYYRIHVLPINIPPLRVRQGDIQRIARHFIAKFNEEYGRQITQIPQATIDYLEQYDWPGNVRELENVISRAMIHMKSSDTTLETKYLLPLETKLQTAVSMDKSFQAPKEIASLDEVMDRFEKEYLQKVLASCDYNKTKTAKLLHISVRSLYYKLEKHRL
ncbi:sigma 54-interacting transcriptional regulator [Bacillus horti]|uniref:PAS domain S-box-containing protein n=1 Tax=Caldalkalibacillus horti TaxID=77523 RepID=A0ABT9W0V1_9BACI|nr:sigma 54-interacting transcriptional regulator [Bacillus horti]MDQ0166857.1 PAS domain S-box-containing protein [Bacillus horti]